MFISSFNPFSTQLLLKMFFMLLPLCGLWHIGSATYIHAKANLAQVLLESAWQDTLHNQGIHKPWPWADTWPVAKLHVPALGLHRIVLAGADGSSLAFGPGHLFYDEKVAIQKNTLIAGHRDTHFAFLRELSAGNIIELEIRDGSLKHYRVENILIVDKNDYSAILNTDLSSLHLITCYPFTEVIPGGPLRYIVQAVALDSPIIEL